MKKILISIFTIFATSILAAGATGAWTNNIIGKKVYDFNTVKIDLKIDHLLSIYNGMECMDGVWKGDAASSIYQHSGDSCKEWYAKDLKSKDKFYLFSNIMHGDWGRDIISLHVNTKDILNTCLFVFNTKDRENSRNEPEVSTGDISMGEGELSQFLQLFAWLDSNQDGMFNPYSGETELYRGLLKDEAIHVLIKKEQPVFIGTAWCAGAQHINMTNGEILCNGLGTGDITQTDSMGFSFIGYAEVRRWQSDLKCGDVSREYRKTHTEHDD